MLSDFDSVNNSPNIAPIEPNITNNKKLVSIRSVFEKQKYSSKTINPHEIQKLNPIKEQLNVFRSKAQSITHQNALTQKPFKVELNIDTDSEEEEKESLKQEQNHSFKSTNKKTKSHANYIDLEITQGVESTKAKQNIKQIMNSNKNKLPIQDQQQQQQQQNSRQRAQVTNQRLSTSSTGISVVLKQNTQTSLVNQLNPSCSDAPFFGGGNPCNKSDNPRQSPLKEVPKELVTPNSLSCTVGQINFLKSLSQNQELRQSCSLRESIKNDEITIDISTNDFFTFIRLQDEIEELCRRQSEIKPKILSALSINKNEAKINQEQQNNNIDNRRSSKQNVGIFGIYAARKFGILMKERIKNTTSVKKQDQTLQSTREGSIAKKSTDDSTILLCSPKHLPIIAQLPSHA